MEHPNHELDQAGHETPDWSILISLIAGFALLPVTLVFAAAILLGNLNGYGGLFSFVFMIYGWPLACAWIAVIPSFRTSHIIFRLIVGCGIVAGIYLASGLLIAPHDWFDPRMLLFGAPSFAGVLLVGRLFWPRRPSDRLS